VGYLLSKVGGIGPHAHDWAQAMLHARGIEGTRVLQGLLSLTRRHESKAIDDACEIALSHGAYRLRTLRELLKRNVGQRQQPLPFLDEHPIIRPLHDYAGVVAAALGRQQIADGTDASTVRFLRHDRTKEGPGAWENSPSGPGREGPSRRGQADVLPSRPGYPSPGCSPAEPDSVSPDDPSVVAGSSFHNGSSGERTPCMTDC